MNAVLQTNPAPTMRDEIDRKAFAQLDRLACDLELGRITEAQFDTGVRTVWECVSGIASRYIIDVISEIQDHRGDHSFFDVRLFYKGGSVYLLSRDLKRGALFIHTLPADESKTFDYRDEPNPSKKALDMQTKIISGILSRGYIQA